MAPGKTNPAAAPLPPLPDLSGGGSDAAPGSNQGMSGLISGIAPIKAAVDSIMAACKAIVQSGTIPGAEQPCGQIVALAASLLPMAAQQMLQPGAGNGPISPVGSGNQPLQGL